MTDFDDRLKRQFKLRAEFFDNSARWVKNKELLDIHRKLVQISNGELILDACCGTGIVGGSLLHNGSKAKVVGFDMSLAMLEKARQRLTLCVNGKAEHFPFLDDVFDAVICRQTLHFLDIPKVIKELFRITKSKGGKIIISQIVPFGEKDSFWLHKIHRKKQLLLKNFLKEEDLKSFLKKLGCVDIVTSQYYLEEPINNWLTDTFFPPKEIKSIKKMFLEAPLEYRDLHHTRVENEDIFDTMRWVIVKGVKV